MCTLAQLITVCDPQRPGRPRATTATADCFITLTHLRQHFLPATVTARRYGLSGQTIRNRLRKNNNPIRARRHYKGQKMTRRHRIARVQWDRRHFIWGMPTGTGFYSVTNPDLHLVMLMAELGFVAAQTSVMWIAACWKGIDLVGTV